MRSMLYEAAQILLVRSTKWSWLKGLGDEDRQAPWDECQRRFDFGSKPLISICFAARSDTVDLTSVRLRQSWRLQSHLESSIRLCVG